MPTAAVSVDFTGVTLPFTVADGLTTATGFMNIFGPWTLLGVGIPLALIIIGIIFWVVGKGKRAAGTK
ncbi:hypothetical protein KIH86_04300 [Paenibacillus sp. HN-1]|uniref:hypothetical protein n=1 Tax=Paenibacillus TaxID=44249 RepID=UPI001CA98F43|nr:MULTISPECIES: hypothetical protein [Paenibacillus]MBY9082616.1 hypothetical protein [Paenibacillus sp. CGMCC 1.18879]MBY9083449.1 hypothetical protein [Paenibacillus sinensis]